MVKVKICGITNMEDALASVDAGCDALGFVFYRKSPRYISAQKASRIIKVLPKGIVKIGVFVNVHPQTVKNIARLCGLNMLQFHGNESAEFCDKFRKYNVIKTFRVKDALNVKDIARYNTFAYLFDTYSKAKAGGTGKVFDWSLIRHLKGLPQPIFLSGGLNSDNVQRAIRKVRPAWVDVCTSVEYSPGKKDRVRVADFIRKAKSC